MQKLKMGREMYAQYKSTVKNVENITLEQAQLKMTRNAQLAIVNPRFNAKGKVHSTHYQYGSLQFITTNDGSIVWMKNYCGFPKDWKRDNTLYLKLNKELGIEDDSTMLDMVKRDAYYYVKRKYKKTVNTIKWKLINKFQTA